MDFNIIDESGMSAGDIETTRLALVEYLKPLAPWNFGNSTISAGSGSGVPIFITARNRRQGAAGYHSVENGKPVIYILPATDKFGYFRAGRAARPAVPGRKIGSITLGTRPAVPGTPDTLRAGQLATICHEVAEVLGDPVIQTVSAPDCLGHPYLRELADPVHMQYYKVSVNNTDCVLPNTVLPNWYLLDSKQPFDVMGWCKAPFQKSPHGYAFWVSTINGVTTYQPV